MRMRYTLLAVGLAALPQAGGRAETQAALDLSLGATAASNPYLVAGDDTGAVGVSVTAAPSLTFEDGDTTVRASGAVTMEYFEDYDLDEAASLGVDAEHRLDERTRLSAELGYRTSRANARRFQALPAGGELEVGEFPDVPVIDPTIGALSGRTSRLDVGASLEHLISPVSSIVVGGDLGLTTVRAGEGEDYRDSSLTGQYSRRLTETTSFLLSLDAGYVDYLDHSAGDAVLVTGLGGFDRRLSPTLHLAAQVGASFTSTETLGGRKSQDVGLAGEVEVCDRRDRGFACANISRRAQPTVRGGITTVTAAQLSYTRALGPWDEVGVSGSYARSGDSQLAFLPGAGVRSELVNLSARYSRRLGDNVSGFISPGFTTIKDAGSERRENYQVMIGVSYSLGRSR